MIRVPEFDPMLWIKGEVSGGLKAKANTIGGIGFRIGIHCNLVENNLLIR